jgi:hypothetical protein
VQGLAAHSDKRVQVIDFAVENGGFRISCARFCLTEESPISITNTEGADVSR